MAALDGETWVQRVVNDKVVQKANGLFSEVVFADIEWHIAIQDGQELSLLLGEAWPRDQAPRFTSSIGAPVRVIMIDEVDEIVLEFGMSQDSLQEISCVELKSVISIINGMTSRGRD